MVDYKNLSKKSNISRYELGDDYIILEFRQGDQRYYKYTYASAGKENVDIMKRLAVQGRDLNNFLEIGINIVHESKW